MALKQPMALLSIRDISDRISAEKQAKTNAARFKYLAEATFEGIGVLKDGILVDANKQLAEMLGCAADEVIGRSPLDFVAPESEAVSIKMIGSNSESPYEITVRGTKTLRVLVPPAWRNLRVPLRAVDRDERSEPFSVANTPVNRTPTEDDR